MPIPQEKSQMASTGTIDEFDAIVVGAGFAGLYALHRLRDQLGLSVRAYEVGADAGGTWYWNCYPGARCDIETYNYSYSFSEELQQEWEWTERFAGQPEILQYLNYVADKFDLRRNIQFGTRISSAIYDDANNRWDVHTNNGVHARAQFLVSGAGTLSVSKTLEFGGLETFKGKTYSTDQWPHDGVDFTGQHVGVIGTGASGIQVIQEVAKDAKHLTVFQRTPNYATPMSNGRIDPEFQRLIKDNYQEIRRKSRNQFVGVPYDKVQPSALEVTRDERRRTYEERWEEGGFRLWVDSFGDVLFDGDANETASEFVRSKIRERVNDQATAELLMPNYKFGTKRVPLESGYYETFNRNNVTLVDVKNSSIEEITPQGVRTQDAEYELDCIIFATGFDAMTGPLLSMGIRGRDGLTLAQKWADGPRTYLGLTIHGFPNLFTITGPQSPSVLYNMPLAIEDHVDWISDCIEYVRNHENGSIEPTREAEEWWVEHTNEVAEATLFPETNSWYMGANIPGKPRVPMVYLGGAPRYRQICEDVVARGYEGLVQTTQQRAM